MEKLHHGGDIYSYGQPLIDFSSNINPLGLPQVVREAAICSIDGFTRYPDPLSRDLVLELSRFENVPESMIFCANGAADIIYRLAYAQKPRRALVTAPTFSEYALALKSAGCAMIYHKLEAAANFVVGYDILDTIDREDIDMVFICNPNNPTGALTEMDVMEAILNKCKEKGAVLVVDECFNGFVEAPHRYTMKPFLNTGGLVILKAFTKLFAMPGLRLGYCLCGSMLIDQLYFAGQAWPVSVIASDCGMAALKDTAYIEKSRAYIAGERDYLSRCLAALGIKIYKPEANYIFFECNFCDLKQEMLRYNILIRDCSNYPGLQKGFYRIAVKTRDENQKLLDAMNKIMGAFGKGASAWQNR